MHSVTILKSRLNQIGGLEKYTWEIVKGFCQAKCAVTLLTTQKVNPPFSSPSLRIVSFPIDYRLSYLNVLQFDLACQRFIEKNPTDIVFSLDRNSFQTHMRAGNGSHAAYLKDRSQAEGFFKELSFRFNPLHRNILRIEKKGFENRALQKLFTNSHMVKNQILDLYEIDPKKIEVVHNGVEWSQMQTDFNEWEEKREQLLAKHDLDPQKYQLLFVGNNYRRKGLKNVLKALPLLPKGEVQLLVIGKDKNAKYFKEMAGSLHLNTSVRFLGKHDGIREFYQMADALIIPSSYDPFANVTVEALAMGLYVISSKNNGGHEVLTPHSGHVIEPCTDPQNIALSIKKALSYRKTPSSSVQIRDSVAHLDFSNQIRLIINSTLGYNRA